MNFNDKALNVDNLSEKLSKRLTNTTKRLWESKRIRFSLFGFNFHLYRKASFYRYHGGADLFWKDKGENKPPFGKGISSRKWNYRIQKVCPIQLKVREWFEDVIYDIQMIPKRVHNWFYDEIYRRIYPCNVIKIKTLPRTYCDERTLLEHSIFQVLTDFVETEMENKYHDYTCDDHWKNWWAEALYLYHWIKNKSIWEKQWEEKIDAAFEEKDITKAIELEKQQENELTDVLTRIVKIREGLWS